MRKVVLFLAVWLNAAAHVCAAGAEATAAGARFFDAFTSAETATRAGWSRLSGFQPRGERIVADAAVSASARSRESAAAAVFTVPSGGAGFYAIGESVIRCDSQQAGRVALQVFVRRGGLAADRQPPPAVHTNLDAGEVFDFDVFLGYLAEGDAVHVSLDPAAGAALAPTEIDFRVTRTPQIPVGSFPEDFPRHDASIAVPSAWSLARDVAANSPAARRLARGRDESSGTVLQPRASRVTLPPPSPANPRETIAIFCAPHSGYYAAHEAWCAAKEGDAEARWYVGDEPEPRRVFPAAGSSSVSLAVDLGYVRKGDTITLAFAARGSGGATVEFAGSIVEWASRRAPLRVSRGADGGFDVFEPENPRRAVDIPAVRWIEVAAADGDATEAMRGAFAAAKAAQRGDDYIGIRLQRGKTYTLGSQHVGGTLFDLRGARRIVFDGNGATLRVNSPELLRREVDLFTVTDSRNLVFADFTVEATSVPFTVGEILDVSPRDASVQTVTFRAEPGAADPIADIRRGGEAEGFAYDPHTPGRLAEGAWNHYPGDGRHSLQAAATPGVFTHRVRRTGASLHPGQKWLIKNKRGGVIYLITQGDTENITLAQVTGRAAGGTHLRFWQTSGVNLLDCRFEPDGPHWISSSADSVHGRGREGVWIEDTVIRGVCEDIMNTYGENMVVVADADATDAVFSIRMFQRNADAVDVEALRLPRRDNIRVGDKLAFFNPQTGRVLGYATVRAIAEGRFTLSNPIEQVEAWEEGKGNRATMVYNTRAAGRFVVRDSRLMDSMRFGLYIKARGGVVFGTHFEGLSAAPIFAANEPEWPEGPPATDLWVQDCFFSRNNDGYMSKHRAFMTVDPADISIYTRRLRAPGKHDDEYRQATAFRAHIVSGHHANNHVKLLGNTFHDWRGMGIAVRNARNVRIEENLFLPPVEDATLRRTLAGDPALTHGGRGSYAGIYLDSVDGVRVAGNRFLGLPVTDRAIVRDQAVTGAIEHDNPAAPDDRGGFDIVLPFSEWFGTVSANVAAPANLIEGAELKGPAHRVGRIGAGLFFDGHDDVATLKPAATAPTNPTAALTFAVWVLPDANGTRADAETIFAQGDAESGAILALDHGRLVGGVWRSREGAWLDLGPARNGTWRHVALVFDGEARTLRGFVDGLEVNASNANLPSALVVSPGTEAFGGAQNPTRLSPQRVLAAGSSFFHGGIDDFRFARRALAPEEIALLALRR